MALAPNALTTLEAVCAEMGVDVPTPGSSEFVRLERRINAVSDAVERYCDRKFSLATQTEKVRGYGTARLTLARTPILAVASITFLGRTIPAEEWELERGPFVRNLVGNWESTAARAPGIVGDGLGDSELPLYLVTYSAGYVLPKDATNELPRTLPYDLEEAAIRAVVVAKRKAGKSAGLVAYSAQDLLPDGALPTLDSYRMFR